MIKTWIQGSAVCLLFLLLTAASCKKLHPGTGAGTGHDQALTDRYPHDEGMEHDPDVLYVENFETDLPTIEGRYTDVLNPEGMSLDPDVPPGSRGKQSLKITNVGGQNSGGHLFRNFDPGFDSTVYLRYYVKYPRISKGYIHHESVWVGGYEPSTSWPNPRAGTCGLDGRLSIAYEPISSDSIMGTYLYWGDLKSWNGGTSCYGNDVDHANPNPKNLIWDEWTCIEMKIKMNNPVTASNGELQIWQNGEEVGHWGPGFPNGHWAKDTWIQNPSDPPFEGFRWRKDAGLNINNLWIEFYDDASPAGVSHYIKYDHLVMAKRYIGPLKD
jgi:hypothetical protein